MVYSANLGYPRIGFKRELKTALESYWSARISQDELLSVARNLRKNNWLLQARNDIDYIPSNDFSLYDHVLDTMTMVGAVPKRYGWSGADAVDLQTYFLMARGQTLGETTNGARKETHALEMTKWFNTNYHFMVPELEEDQKFSLASMKCVDEFLEAKNLGILTRPVLLGPVSFLYLAKGHSFALEAKRLDSLLHVYCQVLTKLRDAGADWVQIDEPCLTGDLNDKALFAFEKSYVRFHEIGLNVMLTNYFGAMDSNLHWVLKLPIQGIHLDLVNGMGDLELALRSLPPQMCFSAGVVDGHNVWRTDLSARVVQLENIAEKIGPKRLIVAPSCSLMHVPIDVDAEVELDADVKPWLAFAAQKLRELSILTDALTVGKTSVADELAKCDEILQQARSSPLRQNDVVVNRIKNLDSGMYQRQKNFVDRIREQQNKLNLPLLPTTTIGSFPQTKEIRKCRQQLRARKIDFEQYKVAMEKEIDTNISLQEKIGLDVLVHGEPERTDMVEYFAELLNGVAVTQHGWVQSYGSRCVRAPIIYGSVLRTEPMTLHWAKFAQSLTSKPVKGMLTGPVTILQWSFVRDDQKREDTCLELALAVRDEVGDLERAGIKIIQIDEPAVREGLPLRRSEREAYLDWAVRCFKLATCGVKDETQIHTHMCYSEFGDMLEAIAAMDADVISIEASRSKMELLDDLKDIDYPNAIGPGIFDIHSPRVPSEDEIAALLNSAAAVIAVDRLWVNPDCGLKTRSWKEVVPALNAMVGAANKLRLHQSDARAGQLGQAIDAR